MQKILLPLLAVSLFIQKAEAYEVVNGGDCYCNARQACCLAAGIGIGVLMIAGMVAVVVNDGHSSHSH